MRKSTFWLLIIGVCAGMVLAWWILRPVQEHGINPRITPQPSTSATPTVTETPTPTPQTKTFDEKPLAEGASYFEKTPVIKGQQNYVMYPITILVDTPPVIVYFSHGSNTTVTTNFKDQHMKDMRTYGKYFASRGYAFVASNMHGANWGSDAAVADMKASIEWVTKQYGAQPKVILVAHSMGGLPSFNFAFRYPQLVSRMALLAPTSRPESWGTSQYNKLKDIPVQIWHGDKDVNVPYSLSTQLIADAKKSGKTISLVTLKGKGHWDVDTELIPQIEAWIKE